MALSQTALLACTGHSNMTFNWLKTKLQQQNSVFFSFQVKFIFYLGVSPNMDQLIFLFNHDGGLSKVYNNYYWFNGEYEGFSLNWGYSIG